MPTVATWANDLRAAFGADEINAALRSLGYYASEGGRTIDTRKDVLAEGLPLSRMVVGSLAPAVKKAVRG